MLVSSFAFTACGSDDEDNNDSSSNPLVGTWYTETIEKGEVEYTEITYNANFTCTWREYKSDRKTVVDTDEGSYKVDGNKLSIWWKIEGNDEPWTTTFTINGNKMTTTEGGGTIWTKK